jgi:TatD DNase family protein
MLGVVDTHAHLDEIKDLDRVIAESKSAGLSAIVVVGSELESNKRVLDIGRLYPGFILPALGLHPSSLKETEVDRNLEFIDRHAGDAAAIGEIGLDYHKRVLAGASKDLQKRVLAGLLRIARSHDKPALLHSRYAWRDCLTMVEESQLENVVFHWYTGPSSVLRDIVGHGYYLSATPAIEYHEEHRRAIREAPLERLLLETDSPVTYGRGSGHEFEARPVDVFRSLKGAALAKMIDETTVARVTTENAVALFGLRSQS